jgi:hypothetical protein
MFSDGAKNLETEVFQLGHVMIIHRNGQWRSPTFLRTGRNLCGPSRRLCVTRVSIAPIARAYRILLHAGR